MKRRVLALLLASIMILALGLSGCASTSSEPVATEPAAETSEPTTEPVQEPVTVSFWHGYTPEKTEVLDEMIARYQAANPTVTIDARFVASGEEMLQKVQAALLSGEEPNMLWGYPTWTGVLASSGKLVNLGAAMDSEWKADLPEGILNAGKFEGDVYSVPIEAGTLYLIYNKDMFAEAGIENPPTTWDELYEDAKLLTKGEQYGVWLPIEPNERTSWTWETFLWQNNGELLNSDSTNIGFNTPEGLEALEFYTGLVKDGYSPTAIGQDPFLDQQAAMIYGTQGAAKAYITKYEMNVGVAMLPGNKTQATALGSNHYFMFKSDEAVEQATLDFMKWMTTGENHAEWAIRTGYLPVSESARTSERYQKFGEENPYMIEAAKALTMGQARPPIEEYPKLSNVLSSTIEKIVYDEMTAEEGMAKIQKEADSIFK